MAKRSRPKIALEERLLRTPIAESVENGTIPKNDSDLYSSLTKQQLNRTGILTAFAIGLHNIPEGVATYIGWLGYSCGISKCFKNRSMDS